MLSIARMIDYLIDRNLLRYHVAAELQSSRLYTVDREKRGSKFLQPTFGK